MCGKRRVGRGGEVRGFPIQIQTLYLALVTNVCFRYIQNYINMSSTVQDVINNLVIDFYEYRLVYAFKLFLQ